MLRYLAILLVSSAALAAGLKCGETSVSQRVIGGQDATKHAWPWQVCGPCRVRNPANYKIVVGEHNRNVHDGSEQTLNVVKVIAHPNYNNPRLSSDIALMQLESPGAVLSKHVNPVCLPTQDDRPGSVPPGQCFITGWGKIKHPGSSHHILQQAMMPPLSKAVCDKKAQQSGFGIKITDQMLCAGIEGSVVSGCHGDSGGPYVCQMPSDATRYVLHGDVSWGSGTCSSSQMFTVFGRVAKFRNWIDQHVGNGGTPPPPPTPSTPHPPTNRPPQPGNEVFSCDFDKSLCGMEQDSNDQFDFTRRKGKTPSYGTGPSSDHSGNGYYIYIETSSPRMQGDEAIIKTPPIKCTGKIRVSFYYHMYGTSMGRLDVKVGERRIFTESGNKKDIWHKAEIVVDGVAQHDKISFIGVRGSGWQGDIALDEIHVESLRPPTMNPVNCDFDKDKCGFKQSNNDNFNWNRYRGSTPSWQTGPSRDHTTGNGHYMYIETSYPRVMGNKAVIEREVDLARGTACLKFYYHMYGKTMGTLNVYVGKDKVFSKSGDQGNQWNEAMITIRHGGLQKIQFEGIVGSSYTSDIAIDDITIKTCGGVPSTPQRPSSPPPPPGSCGIRPHTRIVGGTAASHGSWPWQVQLITTSGFPFCGGSIIHPQWVLSATHCVTSKSPASLRIKAGAHRRVVNVGNDQLADVSAIFKHPSYHKPQAYAHDIALIKLKKPLQLNKFVNVVCLPRGMQAPTDGTKCWITGWGRLASGGATPDYLQQASVPIASYERCNRAYPGKIHDSMICAGLDQGGIDTCQGDSGGPMVCETGNRWYVMGATSWGYGCASAGKFGVYANVPNLMSWVETTMANN